MNDFDYRFLTVFGTKNATVDDKKYSTQLAREEELHNNSVFWVT